MSFYTISQLIFTDLGGEIELNNLDVYFGSECTRGPPQLELVPESPWLATFSIWLATLYVRKTL